MKKIAITFGLIIGLSFSSFATEEPKQGLTIEEQELLDRLTVELEVSLEDMLLLATEIEPSEVKVYDTDGNYIQTYQGSTDFESFPNGNLLMKEGSVFYYLIDSKLSL